MNRCPWAKSELDIKYHDTEWGKPLYDDDKLFELLILETMQSGLSWSTILNKRENYRKALDQFQIEKIVIYDETKIEELMNNKGIIRNKPKIESIVKNGIAYQKIQDEFDSF